MLIDSYGPPLRAALDEHPDVVKLNAEEAADVVGSGVTGPEGAARAARWLMGHGAGAAVVTLGAGGAVVASTDGVRHLAVPAGGGPYTVGSGDALLGGLTTGLVAGRSLLDAAVLGMAAAVANTLVPGAGILDASDAARLLPRVTWQQA